MLRNPLPGVIGACLILTSCGGPESAPRLAPSPTATSSDSPTPRADGTCPRVVDGTTLKIPSTFDLWPDSRSQVAGSNTLTVDPDRSGCDTSNTEPICDAGLPWSGVSAEMLESTFARLVPQRMVAGVIGGGAPPTRVSEYDATHDLRYLVIDFRTPVNRSMRWYSDALRCGRPATFGGSGEGLLFTARSSKNEASGVGPKKVPARLVVRGTRATYLEFSGTEWSVADMDKATRLLVAVKEGSAVTHPA